MHSKIRDLVKTAVGSIPDELGDLSEDAFALVKQVASTPCRHYLHHQRQLEKLERKKGRVFGRRMRLAHHRLWRRFWESRCEALNECSQDRGC